MKDVKKKSRQIYLGERTEKQLLLKRKELDEEKLLFGDDISKEEKMILQHKQKAYNFALQQRDNKIEDKRYKMPQSYEKEDGKKDFAKRDQVMKIKYTKEVIEMNDEQKWEQHQTNKATKQYGSAKEKDKSAEEYKLLLDN